MKTALSAFAKLALAMLVLIQKDELGELLVNGHISLMAVTCLLILWAIAQLLYQIIVVPVQQDLEDDEHSDYADPRDRPIIYHGGPAAGQNDFASRDLDHLFSEKGGFGDLVKRHGG